jgi:hypothetical protein
LRLSVDRFGRRFLAFRSRANSLSARSFSAPRSTFSQRVNVSSRQASTWIDHQALSACFRIVSTPPEILQHPKGPDMDGQGASAESCGSRTLTALTPGFDVNKPLGLARLVLEMSQIHQSSSTLRRSPTCRAIALLNLGPETGRLQPRLRLKDKSADCGRAHVAGRIGVFSSIATSAVGARRQFANEFNMVPPAVKRVGSRLRVSAHDEEIWIRPGRIRPGHRGASRLRSFVAEVTRAARKAGHTGKGFGRVGAGKPRSSFGRVRRATPSPVVAILSSARRHYGTSGATSWPPVCRDAGC